MISKFKKLLSVLVIGMFAVSMYGCGTTSKSTGADPGSSPVVYTGSSSISGAVVASSSDLSKVQDQPTNGMGISSISFSSMVARENAIKSFSTKTIRALGTASAIDGATATLYVLQDDGTKVIANGIDPVSVVNGSYTFDGVKDGVNYIVEVKKIGYDSNGQQNKIELTAPAFVPEGATEAQTVNVSPQTKYAVAMIVEEVVKVAKSADISTETIASIVTAIETAVDTMVKQGILVIPSQVEEYVPEEEETEELSEQDKEFLEQVKNDDTVLAAKTEATTGAKLSKDVSGMSDEEIKLFMADIMGGEGAPDVFLSAFAESYKNGVMTSISTMVNSLYDSLVPSAQIPVETATAEQAKTVYLAKTVQLLGEYLTPLYNYYDNTLSTTNIKAYFPDMDSEDLKEISLFKAIFPEDEALRITGLSGSTVLNVPQGLMLFNALMPMDGPDDGEAATDNALAMTYAHYGFNPDMGNDDYDMPFDPLAFCTALGWMSIDASKVYIMHSEIQARKEWFPENFLEGTADRNNIHSTPWTQTQTLEVQIEFMLPNGFSGTVTGAQIKYKNAAGGDVTSPLIEDAEHSGGGMYSYHIRSWRIKNKWEQDGDTSDISKIITDFGAGTATIEILGTGGVVLASESVNIIKPNLGTVSFIYPAGPNMEVVEKQNWDPNFTPMELDVNDNNVARPIFSWNAPSGTVPEGYELAYRVELRESIRKYDWGMDGNATWDPTQASRTFYSWDGSGQTEVDSSSQGGGREIWNSWEDNRLIRSTSFQCPEDLPINERNTNPGVNFDTMYEFNVTPVLIDKTTQRRVWEGQDSRTEFRVGSVSWTVTLNGTITFPTTEVLNNFMPWDHELQQHVTTGGTWKIALFKMGGHNQTTGMWDDVYGNNSDLTARTPVSSVYTLGSFATVAGNPVNYNLNPITKVSAIIENQKEYSLVLWYDLDGEGTVDKIDVEENTNVNESWVWFTEREIRVPVGINYYNGRLDYHIWNYDGDGNSWGDLTIEANQDIDFDLAAEMAKWNTGTTN